MSADRTQDWDPGAYDRFRELRLRPALDLLAAVGPLPDGDVIDLGCGSGAVGPVLAARFPGVDRIGIDLSQTMLEEAARGGAYARVQRPETPLALIFCNAVLHWLDGHEQLLPALVQTLAPGGVLAIQVPFQNDAPSHRLWRSCRAQLFPDLPTQADPGILSPAAYFELLSDQGRLSLWESTYYQALPRSEQGHPVRAFTQSTFGRAMLAPLESADQQALISAYDNALHDAYPLRKYGSVLFPFRRLFMVLNRAD